LFRVVFVVIVAIIPGTAPAYGRAGIGSPR
jgi:hypothetical protein